MAKDLRFTPQLFEFLRELKANNRKEWFDANKDRYLADARVSEAMQEFRPTRFLVDASDYETWPPLQPVHYRGAASFGEAPACDSAVEAGRGVSLGR